jgi:hypothetical protein
MILAEARLQTCEKIKDWRIFPRRSRAPARWACQNEAAVSPWPRGALTLRNGYEPFCLVLTNTCPKGPRSSAEAWGWMASAAFPRRFWSRRGGIPSPVSTFNLSILFLEHGTGIKKNSEDRSQNSEEGQKKIPVYSVFCLLTPGFCTDSNRFLCGCAAGL